MHVFILGCGRLGASLARDVARKGHQVTVLDLQNEAFSRLGPDFTGRTFQGDGLDFEVLREAGVEGADAFVACTSGDNRNLTASQFARELFHVPTVVSRVSDPLRGQIFANLGLQTVSPTVIGADLIHDALLGKVASVDCD